MHTKCLAVFGMELSAQYRLAIIIMIPVGEMILQIMFPENKKIMGILYTFPGVENSHHDVGKMDKTSSHSKYFLKTVMISFLYFFGLTDPLQDSYFNM